MKASEVLRRYAAGERNFQGVNLKGQSFKGQELSGADFSEADIRSADFTGANLRGAKFCGAKCGLKRRWGVIVTILAWWLGGIAGCVALMAGVFGSLIFDDSSLDNQIAGWVSLIGVISLGLVVIRLGMGAVGLAVAGAGAGALGVGVGLSLVLLVVLVYIGWRTVKGEEREKWVRSLARAGAGIVGTSFRGADLSEANFTGAQLNSTDLREAILTRVRWYGAKRLDCVRPGKTYLQDHQVRQWLRGTGIDKNFDRQSLRGINLMGANLSDASFIRADLSEANLQNADLSRAKLVQTQLDGTDLTGATLTGACIEDWGITTDTILKGVRCDYIFMRLLAKERPTWLKFSEAERDEENRGRKPDDWQKKFAEGDFIDFITPLAYTLNLYHPKPVDPRLVAIAFQELKQANPEAELEIVSVDKKGKNREKLDLKVDTSTQANLSVLHADYFTNLEQLESLPLETMKALLLERGAILQLLLETRANIALNQSPAQGEHQKMTGEQRNINPRGDNSTAPNRHQNISAETINTSGAGAFSVGDIYGTVGKTIIELPSSSNPSQPGIKELLTQLYKAIDAPDLAEDDKEQALDQLKVLAEAGKNPQDASRQKKAKKAVGFLKVIAKGVEPASKLAQVCSQVLPKILAFFGL